MNYLKSVALCTYNGEKFLREQVLSILSQTEKIDEIIVCDDGSTDGTRDILEQFKKDYPGIFSLNFSSDRAGTIQNFSKALGMCQGDIIFLADQDDVWEPFKVERIISKFEKNKQLLLLFSDGKLINEHGDLLGTTLWEKWDFKPAMRKSWSNNINAFHALFHNNNRATGATVAVRKELLQVVDNFEVPADFWHDSLLALHAAAHNGLGFIEESLIRYRIHDGQQIGVTAGSNFNAQLRSQALSLEAFQEKIRKNYPLLFNRLYCLLRSSINKIFNS